MNRRQAPYKAFYFRVSATDRLTKNQFDALVRNYLQLECRGLMCELYADWDESNHPSWDTTSWPLDGSMNPAPDDVKSGLIHFAERGLRELKLNPNDLPVSEFLKIKYIAVDIDKTKELT